MQLVFIPGDGNYEFGLYNRLNTEIVFTLKLILNQDVFLRDSNVIRPDTYYKISTIYSGFINDQPRLWIEYQGNYTNGRGTKTELEKKMRPKQFIRGLQNVSGRYKSGIVIDLIDKLPVYAKEDQLKVVPVEYSSLGEESSALDLRQQSQYSMVKDLHAKALGLDEKKLNAGELLQHQIAEFETWLDWGIRFGQSPLFVIHGMGKGSLKEKIHESLRSRPDVQHFKNEHHPQFGFGATEIILRD